MPLPQVSSLYQFVRDTLAARGGTCTREELLDAIHANPAASSRLERSEGFGRLLINMKHSGFITLDADIVRATRRRVGHRHA